MFAFAGIKQLENGNWRTALWQKFPQTCGESFARVAPDWGILSEGFGISEEDATASAIEKLGCSSEVIIEGVFRRPPGLILCHEGTVKRFRDTGEPICPEHYLSDKNGWSVLEDSSYYVSGLLLYGMEYAYEWKKVDYNLIMKWWFGHESFCSFGFNPGRGLFGRTLFDVQDTY